MISVRRSQLRSHASIQTSHVALNANHTGLVGALFPIDGQKLITQIRVTGCPPLFQPKLRYVRLGGSIIVFWGTLKTTVVELDLQKARWMPVRLNEFPRVLGNYSLCTNGDRIWIYGRQPPYEEIEGKLFRIKIISPTESQNRPRS
jgi:hypothetical protein